MESIIKKKTMCSRRLVVVLLSVLLAISVCLIFSSRNRSVAIRRIPVRTPVTQGRFGLDSRNRSLAIRRIPVRTPVTQGRFGLDPNRRFPCMFEDPFYPYYFKQDFVLHKTPPLSYQIYREIPMSSTLHVHNHDGQYCFIAYSVPNVVFALKNEDNWPGVFVSAMQLTSGLFVGIDANFNDLMYKQVVNSAHWSSWFNEARSITETFRKQYNRTHKHIHQIPEDIDIRKKDLPRSINMIPVKTPLVHILTIDVVGMMPAVSVCQLFSLWSHFYSSGLQALGPSQVTVIVNQPLWGSTSGYNNGFLVDNWLRFLPVSALYLPRNTMFFSSRVTFSPRTYVDVIEPCVFHFLRYFLVPTVVGRIRGALDRGRPTSTMSPLAQRIRTRPYSALQDLGRGVLRRLPVDPSTEIPWWPSEFDDLLRNPPENLVILKTIAGAYSARRLYEQTQPWKELLHNLSYVTVNDTAPHEIRMYLINHAKRLVVMWGGGANIHSFLWGGGVGYELRHLDVFILIHPEYNSEFDGMYAGPLIRSTTQSVLLTRNITQAGGLETFIGPPNPVDHWSEGPFSFAYAWTKLIKVSNLSKLSVADLVISDLEKSVRYDPYCRERLVEERAGIYKKTRYVYEAEKNADVNVTIRNSF